MRNVIARLILAAAAGLLIGCIEAEPTVDQDASSGSSEAPSSNSQLETLVKTDVEMLNLLFSSSGELIVVTVSDQMIYSVVQNQLVDRGNQMKTPADGTCYPQSFPYGGGSAAISLDDIIYIGGRNPYCSSGNPGYRIGKVDGNDLRLVADNLAYSPDYLAVDSSGLLYISSQNSIFQIATDGSIANTITLPPIGLLASGIRSFKPVENGFLVLRFPGGKLEFADDSGSVTTLFDQEELANFVVGQTGEIYASTVSMKIIKIHPDGSATVLAENAFLSDSIGKAIALGEDGAIYFVTHDYQGHSEIRRLTF